MELTTLIVSTEQEVNKLSQLSPDYGFFKLCNKQCQAR